jgi:hypothetical protein
MVVLGGDPVYFGVLKFFFTGKRLPIELFLSIQKVRGLQE